VRRRQGLATQELGDLTSEFLAIRFGPEAAAHRRPGLRVRRSDTPHYHREPFFDELLPEDSRMPRR
jgi:hypothetical protein